MDNAYMRGPLSIRCFVPIGPPEKSIVRTLNNFLVFANDLLDLKD